MRRRTKDRHQGFTLIELMVSIAIIIVLMGIIYAALGPVREKGRQAVCVSNLKQIGQAVAMYRQDYGGAGREEGRYFEMGLPPGPETLAYAGYMGKWNTRSGPHPLWICPDYILMPLPTIDWASYFYMVCDDKYGGIGTPVIKCNVAPGHPFPDFPEAVAQRGMEYPLVIDKNHGVGTSSKGTRFAIILRLGEHVNFKHVSVDLPEWQY